MKSKFFILNCLDVEKKETDNGSDEEKKIVEEIDNQRENSLQNRFFTLAGTPDAGPIQTKNSFGSKRVCVPDEESDPNIKKRSEFNLLRKKISKQAKKVNHSKKDISNCLEEQIFL